ncbi:MAG: hypothetical protein DRH03_05840, partial [Deltaproteobacteria bacterium]
MRVIIFRLLVLIFIISLPGLGFSAASPVIMPQSPKLQQQLKDALAKKGPDYKPRTRHLLV